MLDPKKVRLGICPIGWSNDDMWDLGDENTFQQCISEMKLAGFDGCEVGHKYPEDKTVLKHMLPKKRLTFELFGFERKPQVDRNIAWGFCPSGTSRMLNARQPQAPDAILYLIILPAAFTFKIRNTARKIKTPPSFLTEAFNLSGNIYPSCNPHSLFKPKKRVSSSAMPGSHLRVVWVSPTDKYPSSHNG